MSQYRLDWLTKWAVYRPEQPAIKDQQTGEVFNYRQLNNSGNHLAAWFDSLGYNKGDRIAVLAEFCLEYIALYVAAQKSGLVLVPLNYRLSASELEHILGESMPRCIFCEDKFSHLLTDSEKASPLEDIRNHWNFNQLAPTYIGEVAEDDPLLILYTSGSTGLPKGVLYTHKMTFWNSINTAMSLIINSNTHTVNVMPPFHTGGWNVLLTPILHHGGYVCMVKKFDPYLVNDLMRSESVSVFMGVPTMLHMMAQQENFTQANFETLLYIIVGGEPMPIPLIEQYDKLGVAIRQGYGMTEVGPNLTSLPEQDAIRKKGSIGWPNFYVDIRVVKEDGSEANTDETGELWLRGPMVMPAYWNNPEMTRTAFSPDGQWFKSGDLVRCDEGGYIFVVDRLKNMYISGAENVYPAEIERVINTIEGVAESVVIGVKDERWGEVGKAIIAWRPGVNIPSDDGIRDYVARQLAKFKIPKYFMSLEELPKNDAGKLDRAKLKRLYS